MIYIYIYTYKLYIDCAVLPYCIFMFSHRTWPDSPTSHQNQGEDVANEGHQSKPRFPMETSWKIDILVSHLGWELSGSSEPKKEYH